MTHDVIRAEHYCRDVNYITIEIIITIRYNALILLGRLSLLLWLFIIY